MTDASLLDTGFIDGIVFPNPNGMIGLPSSRVLLLRNLLYKTNIMTLSFLYFQATIKINLVL